MKFFQSIFLFLFVKVSIAQISVGTYHVSEIDPDLMGSYFTIEFLENKEFKLWSRECKSTDYGEGNYSIIEDSIFFNFSNADTSRTEVVKTELQTESKPFATIQFKLFTKIAQNPIDWYEVKVLGKEVDTLYTSLDYLSAIQIPISQETLKVQLSTMSLDKVSFTITPNKSALYSAFATPYFDSFYSQQTWKYKLEKLKRKSFTVSQENKSIKLTKAKESK